MPKRERQNVHHINPEVDEDVDDAPPKAKKKKRRGIPTWMKWLGATAGGAIVGGIAMRKYDEYFPRNKDGDGNDGAPQSNPALPSAPMMPGFGGSPPFMPIFSFGGGQQPFAQPQRNPEPERRRRKKSIAELREELRARQEEERDRKFTEAEDAFFDDED